jgi:hypothetical protein
MASATVGPSGGQTHNTAGSPPVWLGSTFDGVAMVGTP